MALPPWCNSVTSLAFYLIFFNLIDLNNYRRGIKSSSLQQKSSFKRNVSVNKYAKAAKPEMGGIIMYIIIIYRLPVNKSSVQGDQTPLLLVWLESLMEWHYTRGYDYPEWLSSLTHFFKWTVCSSDVFISFKAFFFVLRCPLVRQKEVSVWQINCKASHWNELSSSHNSSWRGRINAWVQISELIQHMLTCDEEGWTAGLLYSSFKTIFVIVWI